MSLEIVCPVGCDKKVPVVLFSECSPVLIEAQISDLFVGNDGFPLSDWTNGVEWADRIDNASTDSDAIRHYTVIGSKPKPTGTEKIIEHKRIILGAKTHTIDFKVYDMSDLNREAVREHECGGKYRGWYQTGGGLLFGGNEGVPMSQVLDVVIDESSDEFVRIEGTWKWISKFSPESIMSPIAIEAE